MHYTSTNKNRANHKKKSFQDYLSPFFLVLISISYLIPSPSKAFDQVQSTSPKNPISITQQVPNFPPLFAAAGAIIFSKLVDQSIGLAKDSVVGWVQSQLGIKTTEEEINEKMKHIEQEVGQIKSRLIELQNRIDTLFAAQTCHIDKIAVTGAFSDILAVYNEYQTLNAPALSNEARLKWAQKLIEENIIGKATSRINHRLLGLDGTSGILADCSHAAYQQWAPESDTLGLKGLYGNEKFYYDRIHHIVQYYLNVQVLGTYIQVTAYNLLATNFAQKEGKTLNSSELAQQVCGDFKSDLLESNALVPTNRKEACFFAKKVMLDTEANLRQQLSSVGAGYSYALQKKPGTGDTITYEPNIQAQYISSIKIIPQETPQVWVLNPGLYPNSKGKSALDARQLENLSYAGLSQWRASATADWNRLLDALEQRHEFTKYDRSNFLDRTLFGAVGLDGFSGTPNNGNRTLFWMANETSEFKPGVPDRGFCFLIPFSIRNNAEHGLGRPLCTPHDMYQALGTESGISNTWYTRDYLVDSIKGIDPPFWFGKRTKTARQSLLAANYNMDHNAFRYDGGPPFNNPRENAPAWIHDTWTQRVPGIMEETPREKLFIPIDQRPEQVIFPVHDVGANLCTEKRNPVTKDGIPTMCGDNFTMWLNSIVKPIKIKR